MIRVFSSNRISDHTESLFHEKKVEKIKKKKSHLGQLFLHKKKYTLIIIS
jgi:hypothetical protein